MFQSNSGDFLAYSREKDQVNMQKFDCLCQWIDDHIDEPICWSQLMQQSGLQYQEIENLFFLQRSSAAMTWIRRRRHALRSGQTAGIRAKHVRSASFHRVVEHRA